MKKFAIAILLASVVVISSCGNSEEEAKKEKAKQDSLSKIDGDVAIDRANQQILGSLDTIKTDTSVKTEKKEKK
jgi:hypothetical protein